MSRIAQRHKKGNAMAHRNKRGKAPLCERAYEFLKKGIEAEHFAEGEVLSEQELAEELGMSRTPVRTAIQRLEEEGLLSVVPRKGAFVNKLSIREYRDVNDLRSVLEPLALETSIRRIPEELLTEQGTLWTNVTHKLEKGTYIDRAELVELDAAFHGIIVEYCSNRRLKGVMKMIGRQVDQIRLFSWMNAGFFSRSAGEHIGLIEHMKRKDLCAAQKLLKKHILLKGEYIESVIGK